MTPRPLVLAFAGTGFSLTRHVLDPGALGSWGLVLPPVLVLGASFLSSTRPRPIALSGRQALFMIAVVGQLPFVLSSTDWPAATVRWAALLCFVVAAWLSASDTVHTISQSMKALWIGAFAALCVGALEGLAAAEFSHGRFTPYGSNPNQVAAASVVIVMLWDIAGVGRKATRLDVLGRLISYGLAVTLILLTQSRGAFLSLLVYCIARYVAGRDVTRGSSIHRIVTVCLLAALIAVGLSFGGPPSGTVNEPSPVNRLGSFEDTRGSIMRSYLEEEISDHPWVGNLFLYSRHSFQSEEIGFYSHNVLVYWLYLGGVLYASVALVAVLPALFRAGRVVLRRAGEPNAAHSTAASIILAGFAWSMFSFFFVQPRFLLSFVGAWAVMVLLASDRYAWPSEEPDGPFLRRRTAS
jgi:hypothetical protein